MKQRLGALLCLVLGTVLIVSGISGNGGATAGEAAPTACGAIPISGQVTNPGTCPTGSIDVTEVTDVAAAPGAHTPALWSLTVSSVGATPCNLPSSGTTINVHNGGTGSFDGLFIYTSSDVTDQTTCEYAITETAVADFTTTYSPTEPYSFLYSRATVVPRVRKPDALTDFSPLAVTVTNTAAAVTTAPVTVVTTTPAPVVTSTTAEAAPSSSTSGSLVHVSVTAAPSTSAGAVIAETGPRTQVRFSLIAGIGLLALGLVLLFAGRRRRVRRHG